jgi:hypothetical protein
MNRLLRATTFVALVAGLPLVLNEAQGQTAQGPQAQALWRPNFSLTGDQIAAIRGNLQGKQKMLATLPAEINPSVISSVMSSPGPVQVSPGSGPVIASPGLSVQAAGVKAPLVPPSTQNYGNLYGVNSPYHYNDILIDGGEYVDFPQSATGMLWISHDGGNTWGWCTASMIGRSILVAAGHCVRENHSWINAGIYIPACIGCGRFDAKISAVYAPYGYSYVYWVETTGGWFNNEGLDQGYDISVLVISKRVGTNNYMGDYTGWNGFCYIYCLQPYWHLRQTGFPSNYDGGNWMYEGHHINVSDSRDYVEGSGAGPGSSGGPWVANAGLYAAAVYDSSTDKGQWPYANVTFATTSWGYSCGSAGVCSYKIQGGSSLSGPGNSNDGAGTGFKGLYNPACNAARSIFGDSSVCGLL